MVEDRIETLIGQAHSLFGKTSIYEIFDLTGKNQIVEILTDFYGPVEDEKIDRYLKILEQLRGSLDP